jgi:hypothetical protein
VNAILCGSTLTGEFVIIQGFLYLLVTRETFSQLPPLLLEIDYAT